MDTPEIRFLNNREVYYLKKYDITVKEYEEQIDNIIYKHFKCSAVELDLIDFAKHVSVPLAVKSNGYKKVFAEIRK